MFQEMLKVRASEGPSKVVSASLSTGQIAKPDTVILSTDSEVKLEKLKQGGVYYDMESLPGRVWQESAGDFVRPGSKA